MQYRLEMVMPDLHSPEDLPPSATTDLDLELKRQLEISISRYFFEACDGLAQSLLVECEWSIHISEVLTLVIYSPDRSKNWRILNRMTTFAERLSQFSPQAKIRVYPPSSSEEPFDMRVDERL